MHVDFEVIDAGARLIRESLDGLPIEDEVEFGRVLTTEQGKVLRAVLGALASTDLHGALRVAARRLPEPGACPECDCDDNEPRDPNCWCPHHESSPEG